MLIDFFFWYASHLDVFNAILVIVLMLSVVFFLMVVFKKGNSLFLGLCIVFFIPFVALNAMRLKIERMDPLREDFVSELYKSGKIDREQVRKYQLVIANHKNKKMGEAKQ